MPVERFGDALRPRQCPAGQRGGQTRAPRIHRQQPDRQPRAPAQGQQRIDFGSGQGPKIDQQGAVVMAMLCLLCRDFINIAHPLDLPQGIDLAAQGVR